MALLEDPNEGAERRPDGQEVQEHSLERQHHRTRQQEEHDVRDHHDEPDRERGAVDDERDGVEVHGGLAADQHLPSIAYAMVGADCLDDGARFVRRRGVSGRGLDQDYVPPHSGRVGLQHVRNGCDPLRQVGLSADARG